MTINYCVSSQSSITESNELSISEWLSAAEGWVNITPLGRKEERTIFYISYTVGLLSLTFWGETGVFSANKKSK